MINHPHQGEGKVSKFPVALDSLTGEVPRGPRDRKDLRK